MSNTVHGQKTWIFFSLYSIFWQALTFKVFMVEKSFKKQNSWEFNFWISGTNGFVPSNCVTLFEPTLCTIFLLISWSILREELGFYKQNLSIFYYQLNTIISFVPCTLYKDLKYVFFFEISWSNLFAAGNTDCSPCISYIYHLISFVNISIVINSS